MNLLEPGAIIGACRYCGQSIANCHGDCWQRKQAKEAEERVRKADKERRYQEFKEFMARYEKGEG